MQFEGCVAEPLQTITAMLPGSKWSCLFFTHCSAGCVERSHKNLPVFEAEVFFFLDDITALVKGRNKDVDGMAKKVMKKFK